MKNKFITLALAAAVTLLSAITAFADYTAVSDGGTLTIPINSEDGNGIILAGYDENDVLIGARYLISEDGESYTAQAITNAVRYRVGTADKDGFEDLTVTTATPAATDEPETTDEPEATVASATVTYPSIYEKQRDAVYTFSVVEKVTSTTDDNGDEAYEVTTYTRGGEEVYTIPYDVTIALASDYYSYLTGENASVLKKGDIVYFEKSLSGKFKAMAFIYRPASDDIITSDEDYGTSFEKLISYNGAVYAADEAGAVITYGGSLSSTRYQYAFGLVAAKTDSEFTLYNRGGLGDDAIDVAYESDTIVYVCDVSEKNEITVGSGSSITKSSIPKSAFDEDDNIESFDSDYTYNYAFARVVDGTATEVVLYVNYNE